MRLSWRSLPSALAAALIAGAAAGAVLGWRTLDAGFPMLFLDTVRHGVHTAVLATIGFLVLLGVLESVLQPRLPDRFVLPLAVAAAGAPFLALAGYRLNRLWGVRPSQVLETWALVRNLALIVAAGVLYLLICAALSRLRASKPGPRRWLPAAAAAAAALLLNGVVLASFRTTADKPLPDVIVLLVDALRADHVSGYGYHRQTTPAIDSLAADGVLFRQAISQSTFTKSSIASLFTARYPYQHGLYWGDLASASGAISADVLRPEETTLAEVLRDAGYLTTAWVQNSHLTTPMGFGQGFVTYRDHQGSIRRINRLSRGWLEGPGRRYSTFAYLHYIDLHGPYRPRPPYDTMFGDGTVPLGGSRGGDTDPYAAMDLSRWGAVLEAVRSGERSIAPPDVERLEALYDGQLRAIDDEIALFLQTLRDLDLYDRSLIVLTSDHGDGFMEHGFISHSTTPYDELVRVPLIVKLPENRHRGRVVERQVRLIDVMPTILDVVGSPLPPRRAGGLERPPEIAGCSLLPLLTGPAETVSRDPDCDVALIEIAEEGAYPIVAVRTEEWKYIHHQNREDELYDLQADPGEQVDLARAGEPAAEELRQLALAAVAARRAQEDRIELDEQQIRDLKALGYIHD